MRKILTIGGLSVSVLAVLGCLFLLREIPENSPERLSKAERIDRKQKQEFLWTHDPALNEVPRHRLLAAKAYADRLARTMDPSRSAVSRLQWIERGPNNVSGRTRPMVIDSRDATGNTVWAGSVSGGLWKTTNALAANPVWIPINDLFGNLAVNSLVQDPSNPLIMYFGTGEGWFNGDAVRGLGLWKSTDGGNNWAPLPTTQNPDFFYTQKLLVLPSGDVLACTRNAGILRSTDGGVSWSQILGTSRRATTNRAADIERAANGVLFAAMGINDTDGVYRSVNNGATWTRMLGGLPGGGYQRIELACAPSDSNRVYALFESSSDANVLGIYRSDNGGTTWTAQTVPGALGMSNFARGQAWYDLIAAVDPQNPDRVFIGGIDLLVSNNGGSTWTQVTQWFGGGGFQYMHADQHDIQFVPGNRNIAFFSNDGGVYRTINSTASTPTITGIFDTYNVTQFYAADLHPNRNSPEILGGTQDNGTHLFDQMGIDNTDRVTGGDGGFSHIDQNQPNIQISSFVYNSYWITSNGWVSNIRREIGDRDGLFINPTDYDDFNNRLYAAFTGGEYAFINGVGTSNTTGSRALAALSGDFITTVRVSPNVRNRVYFGTNSGRVIRVDNAHNSNAAGTTIRSGSPGTVSSIFVETGQEDHILVTYSNYGVSSVHETTDGGTNWTAVEGNLPDMPVRWGIFMPGGRAAALATELGVWTTDTLAGVRTIWTPNNDGLANVRTDMVVFRPSDSTILAATHGRGAYTARLSDRQVNPLCGVQVDQFPYQEGFEQGLGLWRQGQADWFDFTRQQGPTPQSGTGPNAAAEGQFYLYAEGRSPNSGVNTFSLLESPCFNLATLTDPSISFRYHMAGADMGVLMLELSADSGRSWQMIWSQGDDRGADWQADQVALDGYGSVIRLRFRARVDGQLSDIAIDDILVREAPHCFGQRTLYTLSDSISDGSGSRSYVPFLDCDWLIDVPAADSLRLDFHAFDLHPSDTLFVYAGNSQAAPLLGAYTGNTLPPSMLINAQAALVHFQTDASNQAGGWAATYESFYGDLQYGFVTEDPTSDYPTGPAVFHDNNPTRISLIDDDVRGSDVLGGCWDGTRWWVSTNQSEVVEIDPATGQRLSSQAFPLGMMGLSWDPAGQRLLGLGIDQRLYELDPFSGTLTGIGGANNRPLNALAASRSGTLFAVDVVADELVRIDPVSGAVSRVGALGYDARGQQDLEFDPTTGFLYLAAYGPNGGEWRVVDTISGFSIRLGSFRNGLRVNGLALSGRSGLGPQLTDTVDLRAGWNLVSFDVVPLDSSVAAVLGDLQANNLVVAQGFDTVATLYDPALPPAAQTLTHFERGRGYWIRVNQPDQLLVTGRLLPKSYKRDLQTGWNLVAYLPEPSQAPDVYLARLLNQNALEYATGFDGEARYFDPAVQPFFNTLTEMENGNGYWLRVNQNVGGSQYRRGGRLGQLVNPNYDFLTGRVRLPNGERLQWVTESGEIAAEATVVAGGWLRPVAVYADDLLSDATDGLVAGTRLYLAYRGERSGESVVISGARSVYHLSWEPTSRATGLDYRIDPVGRGASVAVEMPVGGPAEVLLYDLHGRRVAELGQLRGSGVQQLRFERPSLPRGAYLLVVRQQGRILGQKKVVW